MDPYSTSGTHSGSQSRAILIAKGRVDDMRVFTLSLLLGVCGLGIASSAFPQGTAPGGPPLFLREDWKHTPDEPEHAVIQESVTTPDVELKLYGQTPQYTDPDRKG